MPFAIKQTMNSKDTWIKIIRRSVILFLIGMWEGFQDTLPDQWKTYTSFHFRIMGVMQRIGLCYLLNASCFYGLYNMLYHGLIVASFIIIYLGFFYFYNVPDFYYNNKFATHCGRGVWASETPVFDWGTEPMYRGKCCNYGAALDRAVFTPNFMYTPVYDPEGIFSTFTSFANTYMGIIVCLVL